MYYHVISVLPCNISTDMYMFFFLLMILFSVEKRGTYFVVYFYCLHHLCTMYWYTFFQHDLIVLNPCNKNIKYHLINALYVFLLQRNQTVYINKVPVVEADLMATNGVVHAVGAIIKPLCKSNRFTVHKYWINHLTLRILAYCIILQLSF